MKKLLSFFSKIVGHKVRPQDVVCFTSRLREDHVFRKTHSSDKEGKWVPAFTGKIPEGKVVNVNLWFRPQVGKVYKLYTLKDYLDRKNRRNAEIPVVPDVTDLSAAEYSPPSGPIRLKLEFRNGFAIGPCGLIVRHRYSVNGEREVFCAYDSLDFLFGYAEVHERIKEDDPFRFRTEDGEIYDWRFLFGIKPKHLASLSDSQLMQFIEDKVFAHTSRIRKAFEEASKGLGPAEISKLEEEKFPFLQILEQGEVKAREYVLHRKGIKGDRLVEELVQKIFMF